MTIAIKVENISKRYKIGLASQRFQYGMLRDVLVDTARAPFRFAASLFGKQLDDPGRNAGYIWALKDVSLNWKKERCSALLGAMEPENQPCSRFYPA